MRAVVYQGTRDVGVQTVEDAGLEDPEDVLLEVTSSAICGTDLHMYDGRTGAEPGLVLGHEPLGVVRAVGEDVHLVRPGQRVVIPTHLFCGVCYNCARGYSAACLRVRPGGFGAAYGYAGMGPYRGAQADLLRVPFADANCIPLPGEPGDEREDDFVMLADAFVTGWHATELAQVDTDQHGGGVRRGRGRPAGRALGPDQGGGRGLRGRPRGGPAGQGGRARRHPDRLQPSGDPVDQIQELRRARGLPLGEEPMTGVDAAIDAVGFQARDRSDPSRENPLQVVERPGPAGQPDRARGYRRGVRGEGSAPGAGRAPKTGGSPCPGPRSSARA